MMNPEVPNVTMAVYLDLENIALGARDANFPAFSIQKVLESGKLQVEVVTPDKK